MTLRTPSDLGYDDDGYILPQLNVYPRFIAVDYKPDDQLFFTGLAGIQDRTRSTSQPSMTEYEKPLKSSTVEMNNGSCGAVYNPKPMIFARS